MNDSPTPRRSALLAFTAVVLATLSALLAAARFRLTPVECDHAWPWPGAAPEPDLVLLVAGAAAGLAAVVALTSRRDPAWRRTLIECLLWPAAPLAAAWLVAPASEGPGVAAAIAVAIGALTAGWLYRREAGLADAEPAARPGRPRARWIWLHVAAVVILAALGIWGEGFRDLRAFGLSLVLYPVYAFCQLFLVLSVLWPRLLRLAGGRPTGPVATLAVLFALVHWPNPTLMILAGGGMAFWAAAYARGRSLAALALSMGLLASLAAQGLPNRWTDHMRVGPRFVRMRTVPPVAQDAAHRTRHLPAGEARTSALIADLYPGIVGREATAAEVARWWRSIDACHRGVTAWHFYYSEEYRRKFGTPAGESPLPGDVHWTRLPAPWPERIDAFTRDAPGDSPPTWNEFLRRLYREILHREPADEEVATWSRDLSRLQKRRLVRVLLDHRRELADAPFDTCTCARMRLHH